MVAADVSRLPPHGVALMFSFVGVAGLIRASRFSASVPAAGGSGWCCLGV